MPQTKKTSSKESTTSKIPNFRSFIIPTSSYVVAIIVAGIILLLGFFKNQFVVATVNGEPISRIEFIVDLEKKQGKVALSSIITEKLIQQEARKKNIKVNAYEIDSEIANIEKNFENQGQKLDLLLSAQNVSRSDLKKQIELQLLLKKMVGSIEVTDKEIAEFIEKNKDSLPESTDQAMFNNQAKQQLEQQKVGEKIQTLVSELQQKAKIEYLLEL